MTTFDRTLLAIVVGLVAVLALIAGACAAEVSEDADDAAAASSDTATTHEEEAATQEEAAPDPAEVEEMQEAATEAYMKPGAGVSVTQARATWTTGYMQAAIYHHLLSTLR